MSLLLTTPRLTLKPHTLANAEKMNAWSNDAELRFYDDDLPEPTPASPMERTLDFLTRNASPKPEDETIHWAMHITDSDEFIGFCMAAYIDRYHRKCRFGMTIGAKEQWGKGYGREVVEAVVGLLFGELQLNRIQCEIYDFNERSIRLFESIGFVREGVCRQAVLKSGRWTDEFVYGLLREDWVKRRGFAQAARAASPAL